MRVLFLDPISGASGNMLAGALTDLGFGDGLDELIARLPIDDVRWVRKRVQKRGIDCLHMDVEHPEQHAHRHLSDCLELIAKTEPGDAVYARAEAIFTALAEAEATVHGTTKESVHFHEVGAVDAIVDVLSAAYLLEQVGADEVICGPVRTGFGFVECDHGTMPIPAPATARLLEGIPCYQGEVEGEFTTPTGAAILKASVDRFARMPALTPERTGWGAGTRDAPHPNALRAILARAGDAEDPWGWEEVLEIRFHLDDMTGEQLADMSERLMETALDVLLLPATGKKGRPVHEVRVIARADDERAVLARIFALSTTLGARVERVRRATLPREQDTVDGVRVKRANGRAKLEHDDLAAAARADDRAVFDVERELRKKL
jgi:uncharacterized protein (TIGR00299 family) protein